MKTLFLTLLTSLTFAQSPFWKMELMENETASSTPDITTGLVALWQNGDTIDATGRGNDLTRSHTNPDPSPAEWSGENLYASGELAYYGDKVWRSRIADNIGNSPSNEEPYWTIHAPYKVSTGLTGIDSAIQFNGIDHYLYKTSTTDLQLGGTDFTIAMWVKPEVYSITSGADILVKDYDIILTDEPRFYFRNVNYDVTPSSVKFWFLNVVNNNNSISLYADGELQSANAFENDIINSEDPLLINASLSFAQFHGLIAQIAIYKRALTQEQIAYLYNGGDGRLIVP